MLAHLRAYFSDKLGLRAFLMACGLHLIILLLFLLHFSSSMESTIAPPTIVEATLVKMPTAPRATVLEAPKPQNKTSIAPPPKTIPQKKLEKAIEIEQKHLKIVQQKTKKMEPEIQKKIKAMEDQRLQKQLDAEAQELSAAHTAYTHQQIEQYKIKILQAISQQWIVPENITPNISCQLRIRLAPNGLVLDVRLLTSSGNPALDQSAINAVYKASPLPVPNDPDVFNAFRELNLTVQPGGD